MTEISFPKSFSVDSLARKPSFTLQNPLNTCPHFALAQFSTHTFLAEFLEKYSLGKVLGHGACSIVCLATLNNSNESQSNESDELFAVKFIQKDRIPISKWTRDRKLGGSVPLEISILSRIQHPNIIKFIEYFEDEKFIYLVTEAFCDAESPKIEDLPSLESPNSISIPTRKRASSSSLVAERRGSAIDLWEATATKKLPVDQVKCIARQLADALVYLHSLKIAHGDIKLENILIDSNSKVKIIDFGGAVIFDENLSISTKHFLGTLAYAPPIQADFYNPVAAEMWCVGVLLNILLHGSRQISSGNGLVDDLIDGLLHNRINAELFQNHEWLKD